MSSTFVSPNFAWDEFGCHDGSEVPAELRPNIRRLCLSVLEPIRAQLAAPLVVVSGYRTPAYNRGIGGALASRHVTGEAADIRPVSMGALSRLVSVVQRMIDQGRLPELGGFGIYRYWIHVDVRPRQPNGEIARWFGKGVGSEIA